jgi:hypothetical protein
MNIFLFRETWDWPNNDASFHSRKRAGSDAADPSWLAISQV